jgi:hypothetical protein
MTGIKCLIWVFKCLICYLIDLSKYNGKERACGCVYFVVGNDVDCTMLFEIADRQIILEISNQIASIYE